MNRLQKNALAICAAPMLLLSAASLRADDLFASPPDDTPRLFGKGFVSVADRYEYGLSISPDGKELLFTAEQAPDGKNGLLVSRKSDQGVWSELTVADLRGNGAGEFEAFHSPDGRSVFFSSEDDSKACRIWRAERKGMGWGAPVILDSPANVPDVFYSTVARDGTLFLTVIKLAEIHRSALRDGKFQPGERILPRGAVHPFVSPDGRFLLCNMDGDIYVSYSKADGSWTLPVNLGPKINTKEFEETCPSLSPDGKYIFFSRYNDKNGKSDIYWVSSAVVGSLKP